MLYDRNTTLLLITVHHRAIPSPLAQPYIARNCSGNHYLTIRGSPAPYPGSRKRLQSRAFAYFCANDLQACVRLTTGDQSLLSQRISLEHGSRNCDANSNGRRDGVRKPVVRLNISIGYFRSSTRTTWSTDLNLQILILTTLTPSCKPRGERNARGHVKAQRMISIDYRMWDSSDEEASFLDLTEEHS